MLDPYRKNALSWAGYDTTKNFDYLNISEDVINDVYPIISEISHEVVLPETAYDVYKIIKRLEHEINSLADHYYINQDFICYDDLKKVRNHLYDNIIYYLGDDFVDDNNLGVILRQN